MTGVEDVDHEAVVILVVGNTTQDKSGVVESLTQIGEWDRRTTADVQILTCKSTGRTVVNTTPLAHAPGKSPTAIARRWISRNGLRRILPGRLVIVVCVITISVMNSCEWNIFSYVKCWVDVFGLIFEDHKGSIVMLVNTECLGDAVPEEIKLEVERFVTQHGFPAKNIIYSNFMEGDDSVSKVITDSLRVGKIAADGTLSRLQTFIGSKTARHQTEGTQNKNTKQASSPAISPFRMEDVPSGKGIFGPWGPERLILLGRTGSGKSTLAQMLTLGALDPDNKTFVSSSGIRGGTEVIEHGEGRGWYVLDTPGFGEPRGEQSTISTQEAENKIKKYVKMLEGTFSHYIYVVKKDRLDQLEERIWKFFLRLFGGDIKQQFSVVVTDADEEWVRNNKGELRACFHCCESFLSVNFPPIDARDEEIEKEYKLIREESLLELEENLAKLNRADMHCLHGQNSKMHVRNERDRANVDMGIEKDLRIKFINEGANACFAMSSFISLLVSPIAELTSLLTVDENIALIPQ